MLLHLRIPNFSQWNGIFFTSQDNLYNASLNKFRLGEYAKFKFSIFKNQLIVYSNYKKPPNA